MEIIIHMLRTQRRIKKQETSQTSVHKDGAFCEYSYQRKPINYFYKKLHLRSLTRVLNAPPEYLKLNAIQKLISPFNQG